MILRMTTAESFSKSSLRFWRRLEMILRMTTAESFASFQRFSAHGYFRLANLPFNRNGQL